MTHGACNHEIKRLENELNRLRAANAELASALRSLRPIVEAIHTALATMPTDIETQCLYDEADGLVDAIDAALSRAEQAKPEPETCVWNYTDHIWTSGCGDRSIQSVREGIFCPFCGKRIEVKK